MAQTPSIGVLASGTDTGRSDTDGITNIGTRTISGTAAPNANGFWSIAVVGVLDDGFHEITAVATLPGQTPGTDTGYRSVRSLCEIRTTNQPVLAV